jgi:hypothetical protein
MGKQTHRRWQQGEDLGLLDFTPIEFQPTGMVVADPALGNEMGKHGIGGELMRDPLFIAGIPVKMEIPVEL